MGGKLGRVGRWLQATGLAAPVAVIGYGKVMGEADLQPPTLKVGVSSFSPNINFKEVLNAKSQLMA